MTRWLLPLSLLAGILACLLGVFLVGGLAAAGFAAAVTFVYIAASALADWRVNQ